MNKKIITLTLLIVIALGIIGINDMVYAHPLGDFKIQSGTFNSTSTSPIITGNGVDFDTCESDDCFIWLSNSRNTSIGRTNNGGESNDNRYTSYISNDVGLTTGGTVTFTHTTGNNNNSYTWQIVEYIGKVGGVNEMKVLDTGSCNVTGNNTSCTGNTVSPTNASDVSVLITGIASSDTTRSNQESIRFTAELVSGITPTFTRDGNATNDIDISYAVVEWTGSNWDLQRITKSISGSPNPDTVSINDVGSLERSFILQAQHTNADGNSSVCQTTELVWLSDTDEISFEDDCSLTTNADYVVWVLSNSEVNSNEKMIVQHSGEKSNSCIDGTSYEENLTGFDDLDQMGVFGMTAVNSVVDNSYPKGSIDARVTGEFGVTLLQSECDGPTKYRYDVVQFPRIDQNSIDIALLKVTQLAQQVQINSLNSTQITQGEDIENLQGNMTSIQLGIIQLDSRIDSLESTLLINTNLEYSPHSSVDGGIQPMGDDTIMYFGDTLCEIRQSGTVLIQFGANTTIIHDDNTCSSLAGDPIILDTIQDELFQSGNILVLENLSAEWIEIFRDQD